MTAATFAYGAVLFAVTEYAELRDASRSWELVDAGVVSVFLKNALVSYLFYDSPLAQAFALFMNVATLACVVLPACGLAKRFTVHFTFLNLSLSPLAFAYLYGDEAQDCAARLLAAGALFAVFALFISHTSGSDVNTDVEPVLRMCVAGGAKRAFPLRAGLTFLAPQVSSPSSWLPWEPWVRARRGSRSSSGRRRGSRSIASGRARVSRTRFPRGGRWFASDGGTRILDSISKVVKRSREGSNRALNWRHTS